MDNNNTTDIVATALNTPSAAKKRRQGSPSNPNDITDNTEVITIVDNDNAEISKFSAISMDSPKTQGIKAFLAGIESLHAPTQQQ